jgi:hypothetical protein
MPRRKWRHVAHEVVERRQTQQRELSACGVPQCGQRQTGMARIVAALVPPVEEKSHLDERMVEARAT